MVVPLSCTHLNDALSLLMVSAKSLPDTSAPLSFQPTHIASSELCVCGQQQTMNHMVNVSQSLKADSIPYVKLVRT